MRLSPHDPFSFDMQANLAFAHFTAGRYAEAMSWAEAAVRRQPNFSPALRILAASNAMMGQTDQARNAAARLLDLNPEFRISDLWTSDPNATNGNLRQISGRPPTGRPAGMMAGCPPVPPSPAFSSVSHSPLRSEQQRCLGL